jgi:hypothetical protein
MHMSNICLAGAAHLLTDSTHWKAAEMVLASCQAGTASSRRSSGTQPLQHDNANFNEGAQCSETEDMHACQAGTASSRRSSGTQPLQHYMQKFNEGAQSSE